METFRKFKKEMRRLAEKDLEELKKDCKGLPEFLVIIDLELVREALLTMWSMGAIAGIKMARLEFLKKEKRSVKSNFPPFKRTF